MKKKVLFLCQGNACHSQMAEGLLKHFYGDKYEVFSAGVAPVEVNKNALEVMKEIGIDISKQTSKHISDFLNQKFDVIITITDTDTGAEPLPSFLNEAQRFNWRFFNPSEGLEYQKDLLKAFRELRDEIKEKIVDHFKPN